MERLFPQKEALFEAKESYIGIPFQKGEISILHKKFHLIQSTISESQDVTFLDLFYKLEPFAANRYSRVTKDLRDKSVLNRFRAFLI